MYEGYETELEGLLAMHEDNCPIPHIKKFTLIKGAACETSKKWVEDSPHVVVAMAIFDMDIYKPTKEALEAIILLLTKGSVLVFDEINCPLFPGETQAVNEVLSLNNIKLHHFSHQPNCAWAIKLLRVKGDKIVCYRPCFVISESSPNLEECLVQYRFSQ